MNAESLCFDCKNALGGCTWSAWDFRNCVPLFLPVDGWDAVTVRRSYSNGHRKSTTYHVLSCPQYTKDPDRDLGLYKEIDKEIDKQTESKSEANDKQTASKSKQTASEKEKEKEKEGEIEKEKEKE